MDNIQQIVPGYFGAFHQGRLGRDISKITPEPSLVVTTWNTALKAGLGWMATTVGLFVVYVDSLQHGRRRDLIVSGNVFR